MACSLIEQLRGACLGRGGEHGILRLARSFAVLDEIGNGQIGRDEFSTGLEEFGLSLPQSAIDDLFQLFDKDKSGTINFDEFLLRLRPPMSDARVAMIKKAFDKMDSTGAGVITMDDLRANYSVEEHPKFKSGEKTQDQILHEFMTQFEEGQDKDQVTLDDWINYYSGVSASIDDDQYFVEMMQNAWKIQ